MDRVGNNRQFWEEQPRISHQEIKRSDVHQEQEVPQAERNGTDHTATSAGSGPASVIIETAYNVTTTELCITDKGGRQVQSQEPGEHQTGPRTSTPSQIPGRHQVVQQNLQTLKYVLTGS